MTRPTCLDNAMQDARFPGAIRPSRRSRGRGGDGAHRRRHRSSVGRWRDGTRRLSRGVRRRLIRRRSPISPVTLASFARGRDRIPTRAGRRRHRCSHRSIASRGQKAKRATPTDGTPLVNPQRRPVSYTAALPRRPVAHRYLSQHDHRRGARNHHGIRKCRIRPQ